MNETIEAIFYPPIACPRCDMAFRRERTFGGEDVLVHPENHCVDSGSTFEAPTFTLKRWYKELRSQATEQMQASQWTRQMQASRMQQEAQDAAHKRLLEEYGPEGLVGQQ